jgi:uncharacterized membrane protein
MLSLHIVSANTNVVVHIDETGIATFAGNGTNATSLPDGIEYQNGSISGSTASLTRKNSESWTFSFSLPNSSIEVYLPELAVVESLEGQLSVNDKQQIRVYANDSIEVSYSLPTEGLLAMAKQRKSQVLLVTIIFVGLIAGLFIFGREYLHKQLQNLSRKKKPKPSRDTDKKFMLITQLLNTKENQILSILRERGPMKSSYLQRISEIPKSSFFRNLQELEKKKLITRSGAGRNKIININIK